jgi:uncharacterized protein YprB with RNaseH-like and TPR domain
VGLSPELFKRLSRLNREVLRGMTTGTQVGHRESGRSKEDSIASGDLTLESAIPGREQESAGGRIYVVRRRIEEFRPALAQGEGGETGEGPDLLARYRRAFFGAGRVAAPADLHEAFRPVVQSDPGGVVYLDIETCGLAGEPLFLVGLMQYREGTLIIEQFLARDYSEERPLLAGVWQALASAACLVTFNGKTFDMPTLAARSLACGLFQWPTVPAHVDLLFEARRRWKKMMPNCRLQTLEQLVCGRYRHGDIPGGDIPAAYHDFVRARRGEDPIQRVRALRRLQTIVHHNALDLVTMADLATRLLSDDAAV